VSSLLFLLGQFVIFRCVWLCIQMCAQTTLLDRETQRCRWYTMHEQLPLRRFSSVPIAIFVACLLAVATLHKLAKPNHFTSHHKDLAIFYVSSRTYSRRCLCMLDSILEHTYLANRESTASCELTQKGGSSAVRRYSYIPCITTNYTHILVVITSYIMGRMSIT
jgi:hypothetical protein